MSEAKYRAYILELSGTVRCLGTFDSEELAQTALDRAQYFRVRINSLQVSCIYVLEETDRLSPKLSPNGLTDSHSA
jgi:hypothetical protein